VTWRFRVLGPVRVERDGVALPLDSQRAKAVLAALVLDLGRPVSVDRLIEAVWGEQPPSRALPTLQVHVSNLRRALGDGAEMLLTETPGYRLRIEPGDCDLGIFDALTTTAREHRVARRYPEAEAALSEALAMWTGAPLADLPSTQVIEESRSWLESRYVAAVEERHELLLRLGRHRDAVPELERLVQRYPLRETLWELLIRAHYASGSSSDALNAYRRARRTLVDELGVEPGERLRAVEAAVLSRSPLPEWDAPGGGGAAANFDPGATKRAPGPRGGYLVRADGGRVPIDEIITIGRHPECTITLSDPAVSRRHAEVRPVMGGSLIVDLSSANGTKVSGAYVAQALLADNDVIEIGPSTFTYRTREA
jgi:SARP family transcriptional regulator, regulator of embCAB operon